METPQDSSEQNEKKEPDASPGKEDGRIKQERDEYLEGWKRAKADLINYKKEEAKRFEEVMKFSHEAMVRELITVLDSFDFALASLEKSDEKTSKGLYLIRTQLENIVRKSGLESIPVKLGTPFDPNVQEAIASVDSDKPSGSVVEEVEKGYRLNGKIIRPARVKVAK